MSVTAPQTGSAAPESAEKTDDSEVVAPPPAPIFRPHGKGKALQLNGEGSVVVSLTPSGPSPTIGDTVHGLSVELSIRPSTNAGGSCAPGGVRYLVSYPEVFELVQHPDNSVEAAFFVSGQRVPL